VYVSSSSSIFFALKPSLILILRPFFLAGGFFLLGFPEGFCGLPFGAGRLPFRGGAGFRFRFGGGGGAALGLAGGGGGGAALGLAGGGGGDFFGASAGAGGIGGFAGLAFGGRFGGGGGEGGASAIVIFYWESRDPFERIGVMLSIAKYYAGNFTKEIDSVGSKLSEPPRPSNSMTNKFPRMFASNRLQSRWHARTVPPVASKSSMITTFCPGVIASL
jgi:hypothetical protein